MYANNGFYKQIGTEEGAQNLINSMVEDYGAIDFLQCVFFNFNQADQERFLMAASRKAGA